MAGTEEEVYEGLNLFGLLAAIPMPPTAVALVLTYMYELDFMPLLIVLFILWMVILWIVAALIEVVSWLKRLLHSKRE